VFRIVARGIAAHRARLAATALAVALGVSFISGTYVLTDTLKAAISGAISEGQTNVSVLVQAASHLPGRGGPGGAQGISLPESTLQKVAAVPGVREADDLALGPVTALAPDGRKIGALGGYALAFSVGTVPDLRPLTLRAGRFAANGSVADLDVASAQRDKISIGQTISVAGTGAAERLRVVGLVGYGSADSLAGESIVGLTVPTVQRLLAEPGRVYEVLASAQPGVTSVELRARVQAALGPSYKVQTRAQALSTATANINRAVSIFGDILLVFAGVALFVAVFLIFNTFSILIAQRSRELALLRCLGAHRRQLLGVVELEAGLIGLVASGIGMALGVLLALGLRGLLGAFGVDLPTTTPVIALRTVIVSIVVGTVATLVAASLPALRASRTAPIAALRNEPTVDAGRPSRFRGLLGAVLIAAGVLTVLEALHSGGGRSADAASRAEVAGLGLVLGFLGLSALVPLAARPLASVLGWPLARTFGVPGQLGRRNAMRHPRRTASTAAALMIGLTLVTTIAVFARSVQTSVDGVLDAHLHADVLVTTNGSTGLNESAVARVEAVPQVTDVAGLDSDRIDIVDPSGRARRAQATGTDVATYQRDVSIPATAGDLGRVGARAVAVTTGIAAQYHLAIGSPITLESSEAAQSRFTVVAIIHDPTGLTGDVLLSTGGFALLFPQAGGEISMILARAAPGVSPSAATAAVRGALASYPEATVASKQGYINTQNGQFQQLIGLVTALLGLAVVIALFGIVNTLALSVIERTREIGLLRALGMSRRQLRGAVRWESVVVAVLGTVLGITVGLLFSWVVVQALRSDGLNDYAVPVTELAGFVALSVLAGIVAAVIPARSAARVDVLRAITTE
jgi:putative ABC transport system permease protein